jgi:hypothetical protein
VERKQGRPQLWSKTVGLEECGEPCFYHSLSMKT